MRNVHTLPLLVLSIACAGGCGPHVGGGGAGGSDPGAGGGDPGDAVTATGSGSGSGGATSAVTSVGVGGDSSVAVTSVGTGANGGCAAHADCEALMGEVVPAGCAVAVCEPTGACTYGTIDGDGDSHRTGICSAENVFVILGDDCDDDSATYHPGAWDGPGDDLNALPDSCNGIDEDCDGTADDNLAGSASCTCDPAVDLAQPCFEQPDGTPILFPGGSPQGSCQAGTRDCIDGAWSACTGAIVPAAADGCAPGNDDDCDGTPNEGCITDKGIGEPCGGDAECTSNLCVGWCTDYCSYDYQCPGDSWCVVSSAGYSLCFPGCDTSADCSGYPGTACQWVDTSSGYYTEVCAD